MGKNKDEDEWSLDVDSPGTTEVEKKEKKEARRRKKGIPKEPLFTQKDKISDNYQ